MIESEIRWGTGYDNIISFASPAMLDDTVTYRRPVPGSRRARNAAGVTDAWIRGRDFILSGTARHFKPSAWGGVGLQDFLDWAGAGNAFRFVPDSRYPSFYVGDCYLDDPFDDPRPQIEQADGWQSINITIRQQAYDFTQLLRGLMFEYAPGKSITDPSSMLATYSRASTARRVGRDGVIASEAAAGLRDRHFVNTYATRTTLLEAVRTNDWSHSEELDNANWIKADCTITANATTAPDGTVTADKLVENSLTNAHQISRGGGGAPTDNTNQTFSFFVKAAERSTITILARTKAGAFPESRVNLTTGAVTSVAAGLTVRVESLANSWLRVAVTYSAGTGASTCAAFIEPYNGGRSYLGDGTSGIYLWGLQWETDAAVASSYIPTTTASVTRSADSLYFPFAFVPQEMTVYVKFTELGTNLASSTLGLLGIGGSTAASLYILNNGSNRYETHHKTSTTTVTSTATAATTAGDTVELRLVLGSTGTALLGQSVNSGTEATGSASAANTLAAAWVTSRIYLGSIDGSPGLAGFQHVKVAAGVKTMAEMRLL